MSNLSEDLINDIMLYLFTSMCCHAVWRYRCQTMLASKRRSLYYTEHIFKYKTHTHWQASFYSIADAVKMVVENLIERCIADELY